MTTSAVARVKDRLGRCVDWALWHASSGSTAFWRRHYEVGGTSGPGSYGALATYKADVVNRLIHERGISSLIELGCGDGNQLGLITVSRYVGLDVSRSAIERCIQRYGADPTKTFLVYDPSAFHDPSGALNQDLALSMDVIFHLVEDRAYERYMRMLFASARLCVVIYSSNKDRSDGEPRYTRHRPFVQWVGENITGWELVDSPVNPLGDLTGSSFYVFTPVSTSR